MWQPQSNLEKIDNPDILKDNFSSRTDPSIFTLIAPVLLDGWNETGWLFSSIEINNPLPAPHVLSR